jgi:hypothetical protein
MLLSYRPIVTRLLRKTNDLPTTLRLFYEKSSSIGQTGKNAPEPALSFSDKRIISVDFQEMLKHRSTFHQVLAA